MSRNMLVAVIGTMVASVAGWIIDRIFSRDVRRA
jgi:hypothetical protein